jgi:hypothetical protein
MSTRHSAIPPSRNPAIHAYAFATLLTAVTVATAAFFAGRRTSSATAGPSVYDAALPDSAPLTFAAAMAGGTYGVSQRNISLSAAGDFLVYSARQGDSTSLWYRSLGDATAHPIGGTRGGYAPRISPDGSRVAFLQGERLLVIPISGGEARRLQEGQAADAPVWISSKELLAVDLDGNRMNWLDAERGRERSRTIPRCVFGYWIPESRQLLCSFNRMAQIIDPESGDRWTIRAARPDGSPGNPLGGTAFRLVDGRYLVYLSIDGSLLAAGYDRSTHLANRPVALLAGVRREAIGEAQYDLAANGTLLYAPGLDATVGRMVSLRAGGVPTPLRLETADFQRYDLSRDRRWLAASVQGSDQPELRVYDLRDGQRFTWLKAEQVRHPLWSRDGEKLIVGVRDSTRWSILLGSPSSGQPPDTLAVFEFGPANPDPVDFHDDHLAVAQDWSAALAMRFDPSAPEPGLDTVLTGVRFTSVSPNGRLIAFQTLDGSRIVVASFPVPGRRWQIASEGVEPLWLSATEILYRKGVTWYLARINPETGEPLGEPTFWASDPRFSDTSGWSNRPSHDGGIIYVQGPAQTTATYLRVVPNWVARMKAAVDAANR